ncbi:MAG: hypothetical protein KJ077_07315 [Anaerolineae bacterium]|nr:hypothetical protein [Anaerolineae bacterium]
MTIKRNLFIGTALSALAAGTLFTAGRNSNRKAETGWNREQWLRLLSGANSSSHIQPDPVSRSGAPAEIIGRTDYPLYR